MLDDELLSEGETGSTQLSNKLGDLMLLSPPHRRSTTDKKGHQSQNIKLQQNSNQNDH